MLVEPDEALAVGVAKRLRPVALEPGLGESEARLLPHQAQIRAWLEPEASDRGLRLSKVQQLLARQGVAVPYSSLHRFATKHCGFADAWRITVRVADVAPGELAEVDFGRLGLVPDPETGQRRVLHALIITLVYSRHQYVHVTHSQKLADLIEGLEDAWAFFGGVPARVVLDNLKAAVTKADRYDPVFQRTFAEYARYRGFVVDAAVPRHRRASPMWSARSSTCGRTSSGAMPGSAATTCSARPCAGVSRSPAHASTARPASVPSPSSRRPKPRLQPLVRERFDPPEWAEAKVHPDHHIQFRKALYSVPTRHVGKRVWIRGDSKLIRIYVAGECVKTHERVAEGARSTDRDARDRRDPDASEPRGQLVLLPTRFLRPAGSFTHHPKETTPDGDPSPAQDRDEAPQALGSAGDAARPGGLRPQDEAR